MAARFTSATAAAGASGRRRCAPANAPANGTPAANPRSVAPATATGNGRVTTSRPMPAAATRKLARITPGRPISRPPSGRERRRGRGRGRRRSLRLRPTVPRRARAASPTQLPRTTEIPNDAACMTHSGMQATVEDTCAKSHVRPPLGARRHGDHREPRGSDECGRLERRPPPRPERHERQSSARRRHRGRAVQALGERRPEGRADVRRHLRRTPRPARLPRRAGRRPPATGRVARARRATPRG